MGAADPHTLFRHAAAFERASALLAPGRSAPGGSEGVGPGGSTTGGAQGVGLAPYVVNSVFALELYLKCLLMCVKGKYPQLHSIQALFFDLPDDEIARVRKLHRQIYQAHEASSPTGASGRLDGARRAARGEPRRSKGSRTDDLAERADARFDAILAGAKDAFTLGRYGYEAPTSGGVEVPDVGVIIACVRGRILVLHPEWRQDR